jgi:hypothetical protein
VEAREQAIVGHALHIAAHGLQGHAELFGKLFDRDRALTLYLGEQGELSGVGFHGVIVFRVSRVSTLKRIKRNFYRVNTDKKGIETNNNSHTQQSLFRW